MIDAHAHLDFRQYDQDRQAVLGRAWQAGLSAVVTIGIDAETSDRAVRIAERNERIFATAGVHPHDAKKCSEEALARIEELLEHPKVVAVGEIGLDFFKNYSPRDEQETWFRRLLSVARRAKKPLVIHDREAHDRILEILKEEADGPYAGMFHCFSGDADVARRVLDLGFDLSFTGTITYPGNDAVREAVRLAPWDRIHVETDCPFLAPVPRRGKRNEPAYVRYVLEEVARIKGVGIEEADRRTEANTRRLFGIG